MKDERIGDAFVDPDPPAELEDVQRSIGEATNTLETQMLAMGRTLDRIMFLLAAIAGMLAHALYWR